MTVVRVGWTERGDMVASRAFARGSRSADWSSPRPAWTRVRGWSGEVAEAWASRVLGTLFRNLPGHVRRARAVVEWVRSRPGWVHLRVDVHPEDPRMPSLSLGTSPVAPPWVDRDALRESVPHLDVMEVMWS